MGQNMLLACVGTVVRSTILCCPRARGSFVFVVAFVFPGGSAESSYTSASASVRGLRPSDFFVPFVQLRLCMLGASVGKPVQSAVFCCPRARVFCSAVLHSSIVSRLFLLPHLGLSCLWAGCG